MQRFSHYYFPVLWTLVLAEIFSVSLFFQGIHDIRITAVTGGLILFGFAVSVVPGFSRGWCLPRSGTALMLLLFWLYLSVSTLWSVVPYVSMIFAFIIGTLPFLFFILLLSPQPVLLTRICFYAVGGVMVVVAGWALIQFFFLSKFYGIRIHHPLLSPNNLGIVFTMALVPCTGFFLQAQGTRRTTIYAVLSLLFFAALLVTQSRGALLAAGIGGIVLLAITARGLHLAQFKLPGLLMTYALIFVGLEYFTGGRVTQALERFENINDDFGLYGRIELWQATWRMAMDHFWLGSGLGTFFHLYPAYRVPRETSDGFFAHMDPLQFWAEMGVLAPVLFYGLLIAILLRTDRAMKACKALPDLRMNIAAPFSGLIALALHLHMDFDLYVLPVLFPIVALITTWYMATEAALDEKRIIVESPVARWGGGFAVSAILAMSLVWIARAGLGIWYISKAASALAVSNITALEQSLDQARLWSPANYSSVYEYRGRLAALKLSQPGLSQAERLKFYEEGEAEFAQAGVYNPFSPYALNFEAYLYLKGYEAGIQPRGEGRAIKTLLQAIEMDPLFVTARVGLAQIYLNRGEGRAALEILKAGLPWPRPRVVSTVHYLMMTATLVREFDHDGALYEQLFLEAKNLNESLLERSKG